MNKNSQVPLRVGRMAFFIEESHTRWHLALKNVYDIHIHYGKITMIKTINIPSHLR